MTLKSALKAEIGDVLFSAFTTAVWGENDEAILVQRARDVNGIEQDTGGWFYHRNKKECYGGNIQDFRNKPIIAIVTN